MSVRRVIEHLMTRRYLDAYLDGEITDPSLAVTVGRHIAECPTCNAHATTTTVVKHRLSLRRFLPGRAGDRTRPTEP